MKFEIRVNDEVMCVCENLGHAQTIRNALSSQGIPARIVSRKFKNTRGNKIEKEEAWRYPSNIYNKD